VELCADCIHHWSNRAKLKRLLDHARILFKQSQARIGTRELNRLLRQVIALHTPLGRHEVLQGLLRFPNRRCNPTIVIKCNDSIGLKTPQLSTLLVDYLRDGLEFAEIPIRLILQDRTEDDTDHPTPIESTADPRLTRPPIRTGINFGRVNRAVILTTACRSTRSVGGFVLVMSMTSPMPRKCSHSQIWWGVRTVMPVLLWGGGGIGGWFGRQWREAFESWVMGKCGHVSGWCPALSHCCTVAWLFAGGAWAQPRRPLEPEQILSPYDWLDNRDYAWFAANIPLLDKPDSELNQTYYYRLGVDHQTCGLWLAR
jgi:hypothetical protein